MVRDMQRPEFVVCNDRIMRVGGKPSKHMADLAECLQVDAACEKPIRKDRKVGTDAEVRQLGPWEVHRSDKVVHDLAAVPIQR